MEPKDLAILGGAFSSIVAALSYWAKTRHEHRRATRTVLYYLLELHHLACRLNMVLPTLSTKLVTQFQASLKKRGVSMTETEATDITGQLDVVFRAFASKELRELVARISEPLEKSLADLAREDPVLAFRLRGREQLMVIAKKVETILLLAGENGLPATGGAAPDFTEYEGLFRGVAVAEMESALRTTAWRCDVLTHLRVRLLLWKAHEQISSELDETAEDLIIELLQIHDTTRAPLVSSKRR